MGGSHLLEWWLTFAGQMAQNYPDYSLETVKIALKSWEILHLCHNCAILEVQEKYPKSRKNPAPAGGHMYKFERYRQLGLADFNQPAGLKMNLENCWVRKAATLPWDAIEEKYAGLFPSKTGMPAGNITEDAIKNYIQEQSEESRKEENRSTSL